MSRVYDALQRSQQGNKPGAGPLVPEQPEAAAAETQTVAHAEAPPPADAVIQTVAAAETAAVEKARVEVHPPADAVIPAVAAAETAVVEKARAEVPPPVDAVIQTVVAPEKQVAEAKARVEVPPPVDAVIQTVAAPETPAVEKAKARVEVPPPVDAVIQTVVAPEKPAVEKAKARVEAPPPPAPPAAFPTVPSAAAPAAPKVPPVASPAPPPKKPALTPAEMPTFASVAERIADPVIPGVAAFSSVPMMADVPMSSGTPTEANWLNVPAARILHPDPTPEQRLVSISDPDSPGAEMFRVLSTRLAHMQTRRQLQKLLITSSVTDEGKSVVAVNLALTLARRPNQRTLLVEADLRRPTARALLSSSPLPGITEWSRGNLALENALYRVKDLPLWFLSAGHGLDEPLPLLESERFARMLATISSSFDWVVLDATPMLPMADSTSLSRLCDGVLVVVREGVTRRRVLNKALATIDRGKLLGMVFNQASMLKVSYKSYYSTNGSGKSKKPAKEEAEKATTATA